MKVFLCETIHPEAYRLLAEHAEIISSTDRMGEADALISRVISVGAAEMDAMPELKVIAVHGTGTDGIDLTEAKKRGIRWCDAEERADFMEPIEFKDIRYILAVENAGSFSRAAEKEYISQPALSRIVKT